MTWNRRGKNPSKIVSIGDEVRCCRLSVDTENRRISWYKQIDQALRNLSLKNIKSTMSFVEKSEMD